MREHCVAGLFLRAGRRPATGVIGWSAPQFIYFMKPRPLAVDPKSFERSGVPPPADRARLGIRSVIGPWPPQSDRQEPSSSPRAQSGSG